MSVTRILSHRMAARHRLFEHEDPEIRTNTDSESETDLEGDLDLGDTDGSESIGIDEPSYENFSQIGSFITGHGLSSANREWIQGDFSSSLYSFDSSQSRTNQRLSYNQFHNPVDFFRLFVDRNLIEIIVRQTNICNRKILNRHLLTWLPG